MNAHRPFMMLNVCKDIERFQDEIRVGNMTAEEAFNGLAESWADFRRWEAQNRLICEAKFMIQYPEEV